MEEDIINLITFFIMMLPVAGIALLINHFVKKHKKAHPKAKAPETPVHSEPVVSHEPVNRREYRYHIHGLMHKNEKGKDILNIVRKVCNYYRDEWDAYKNLKKSDFEENPWMEVSEFEDIPELAGDVKATTFNGDPAVKVYLYNEDEDEDQHIGWIPKEQAAEVADMIKKHKVQVDISIDGGDVKKYDGERIIKEHGDVFLDALISYEVLSRNGVDK